MTIDDLIAKLQTLKETHDGDVEVTVWKYDGGLDALCDVYPMFNSDLQRVVLETTFNESGIRQ